MRISALSMLLLLAPFIPAQTATKTPLFDGKSLSGWQSEGDAKWQVEGELRRLAPQRQAVQRFHSSNRVAHSPKGDTGIFVPSALTKNDPPMFTKS